MAKHGYKITGTVTEVSDKGQFSLAMNVVDRDSNPITITQRYISLSNNLKQAGISPKVGSRITVDIQIFNGNQQKLNPATGIYENVLTTAGSKIAKKTLWANALLPAEAKDGLRMVGVIKTLNLKKGTMDLEMTKEGQTKPSYQYDIKLTENLINAPTQPAVGEEVLVDFYITSINKQQQNKNYNKSKPSDPTTNPYWVDAKIETPEGTLAIAQETVLRATTLIPTKLLESLY